MKFEIIKWKIEGHRIGEIIELSEEKWRAYWDKYLKPVCWKGIFQSINDFTAIQNKAIKPRRGRRKKVETPLWL